MLEELGHDTLEVFGESGTGKTTFCLEILNSVKGKKSIYIDTEKNILSKLSVPSETEYIYVSDFKELYRFILSLKDGYKLVILDSLGLPILGEFATLNLNERGDVLLKAQAISYELKKYSQRNEALVIVTNQPESEFAKEKGHILRPFGDKSIYFFKEVWKTSLQFSTPNKTVCSVKSFRSRSYGRGKPLFKIIISDEGRKIEDVRQRKAEK